MDAKPAIVPVTIPTNDALPYLIFSQSAHVSDAVAAEICVTVNAIAAPPSAANCDPPLKPNQPTHNMAAPIITYPGLCGGVVRFLRGPSIIAKRRAAKPAVS